MELWIDFRIGEKLIIVDNFAGVLTHLKDLKQLGQKGKRNIWSRRYRNENQIKGFLLDNVYQCSGFTGAYSSAFNRFSPVWLVYVAACPPPRSLSNGHSKTC